MLNKSDVSNPFERIYFELEGIRGELALLRGQEGKGATSAKQYLTLDDTVSLIGLSRSKLYRLTSRKQIPFLKVGGKIIFRQSDLDSWLDAQAVQPTKRKKAQA